MMFLRLYTVTEPTITRQLVKIDTPAAGFYALNGESVLQFMLGTGRSHLRHCSVTHFGWRIRQINH